ncbi:MAG: glycoside hydrolase [Treponema sp.]|jgi:alpha-D-xyloside xylohydrolase|nr:glycoside hydrolase [Treponema sp.]
MERIVLDSSTSREWQFTVPGGTARISKTGTMLSVCLPYKAVYGMGEKFDRLNKKGFRVINKVEEHFCEQGEHAYCPMPFFFTDSGFGLYVDTGRVTVFEFGAEIHIYFKADAVRSIDAELPAWEPQTEKAPWPDGTGVVLFSGSPAAIIQEFMSLSGPSLLPPEWAFGVWISANRWHSQEQVFQQLTLLEKHRFPASVLVLEAWSDEATFYIWNGAAYTPKEGGECFAEHDFDFSKSTFWPDPGSMIEKLHGRGLRLVLWQIPVYKPAAPEESIQQNIDRTYAAEHRLAVQDQAGRPYEIPQGHWFAGSLIPDWTNAETRRLWFAKRRYLLEMGVDGFKTDGGEFIYQEDLRLASGARAMINGYAQSYIEAYAGFTGPGRVLFSRAGYTGLHTASILWSGDQKSSFAELQSCLRAGLSAALSGIIFWGFDTGGFAGPLPSAELYLRATELACFCPVMQWHSEPEGGQFAGSERIINNERSPWNIAAAWFDTAEAAAYLEQIRFYHELRMKLVPYLCKEAARCVRNSAPLMRPLVYDFPGERECLDIDDEFMLGPDILAAPVLSPRCISRTVWFPPGTTWCSFFDGASYSGGGWVEVPAERIPVFIREGREIF